MNIKKIALFFILCLSCLLFIGCGPKEEPIADSDGGALYMNSEQMEEESRTGYYILSKDGIFTPLMSGAEGYQGETAQAENVASRYLWYTNNVLDLSSLIPVLRDGDQLVLVEYDNNALPALYTLERYLYRGYSIGCHIYREENQDLYITTSGLLQDSHAGVAMEDLGSEASFLIAEINGSAKLPKENVDNSMQLLLGLEKGKLYDFSFYQGTKYKTLSTIADSLVFQSAGIITLPNPYTRTEKGYFVINLPDNLKKGFYYCGGAGLFRFEP